jgi:hypothetical protein
MEDVDGNNTCDETNETGEQNKPQVMLTGNARKNTEHRDGPQLPAPPIGRVDFLLDNFSQLSVAWLSARKPGVLQI